MFYGEWGFSGTWFKTGIMGYLPYILIYWYRIIHGYSISVHSTGCVRISQETSCLENCTKRFVESTQYIMQRAQHKAGGGQGGDMFQ